MSVTAQGPSVQCTQVNEGCIVEVRGSFLASLDKEAECYEENMGDTRQSKD